MNPCVLTGFLALLLGFVSYKYGLQQGRVKESKRLRNEWKRLQGKRDDFHNAMDEYRSQKFPTRDEKGRFVKQIH